MRRALMVLLVLAACGGGGAKTAAPSTTISTTTTTTAPATTTDPKAADLALVKAMWRASNLAWKQSNEAGIEAYVASAWPPGGWTTDMLSCFSSRVYIETIVDEMSFEPDLTFTLPPGNYPGAGMQPPGRVYISRYTTTVDGSSSEGEGHSAGTIPSR